MVIIKWANLANSWLTEDSNLSWTWISFVFLMHLRRCDRSTNYLSWERPQSNKHLLINEEQALGKIFRVQQYIGLNLYYHYGRYTAMVLFIFARVCKITEIGKDVKIVRPERFRSTSSKWNTHYLYLGFDWDTTIRQSKGIILRLTVSTSHNWESVREHWNWTLNWSGLY